MATFTIPNVFVANTVIKSADMNANFAAIAAILNSSLLPPIGGTPGDIVSIDGSGNFTSIPAPAVKGDLLTFSTVPDVLPVGTDGQVLQANSTAPSGIEWVSAASNSSISSITNLGLAAAASSGALTISITQADGSSTPTSVNPTQIPLRSLSATVGGYNVRSLISALSLVLPANATFNMLTGQNSNLWVYMLDSDGAGTLKVAASKIFYDDTKLMSTTVASTTVTIPISASVTITSSVPHGYVEGDAIAFETTGTLPTGITGGTIYYVTNPTSTTFQIFNFPINGTLIDTSGSQSGTQTIVASGFRPASDAAYLSVPCRLLGKVVVNLPTPGVWPTPASISLDDCGLEDEIIVCKYDQPTGQSFSGGFVQTVTLGTLEFDTHNLALPNISSFQIPKTGYYTISGEYNTNSFALATGNFVDLEVWVNGSFMNSVDLVVGTGPVIVQYACGGETKLLLNQNDYVTYRINPSQSVVFSSAGGVNYITMEYLGPAV